MKKGMSGAEKSLISLSHQHQVWTSSSVRALAQHFPRTNGELFTLRVTGTHTYFTCVLSTHTHA